MRAFTLIEMMVTVSLIAIISAFTVINLNFQRDERKVEQEAKSFYGQLLYARNLSVSGKIFQDEDEDGDIDVPRGYGIALSRFPGNVIEYLLYADSYAEDVPYLYDNARELREEFVSGTSLFDAGIQLELNGAMVADTDDLFALNIFFPTPSGEVQLFDGMIMAPLIGSEQMVEFSSISDPSVRKIVVIKTTGQIYVQ